MVNPVAGETRTDPDESRMFRIGLSAFVACVFVVVGYLFFGPFFAGFGFAIGWVLSSLLGIGIAWPILACVGLAISLTMLIRKLYRDSKYSSIRSAAKVAFIIAFHVFWLPAIVGFTYSAITWDYGDGVRKSVAILGAAAGFLFALLWTPFQAEFEMLDDDDDPPRAQTPLERRASRLIVVLGLVTTTVFALIAFADEGLPALLGTVLVCGAASAIIGCFIYLMISWIISDDDGEQSPAGSSAATRETSPTPIYGIIRAWIVGTAVLVVLCHDGFWYFNWVSSIQTLNVTHCVGTSLEKDETRDSIGRKLATKPDRWALSCLTARPLRWGLTEDTLFVNRATLDIVDLINGEQPSRIRFGEDRKLIQIGVQLVLELSDTALQQTCRTINGVSEDHCRDCLRNAWTYRIYEWLADKRHAMLETEE